MGANEDGGLFIETAIIPIIIIWIYLWRCVFAQTDSNRFVAREASLSSFRVKVGRVRRVIIGGRRATTTGTSALAPAALAGVLRLQVAERLLEVHPAQKGGETKTCIKISRREVCIIIIIIIGA